MIAPTAIAVEASVFDTCGSGPRDPVMAAIEAHRKAYDAWDENRSEAMLGVADDPSDARLSEADRLLYALTAMVPQSVAGLIVYIEYFAAYSVRDEDPEFQHPALASMASACRRVLPTVTEEML